MMYKTPFNSEPDKGEVTSMPSVTIPGQTLSIAEMLNRINNGQPISRNQLEFTNEDEPFPKVKDLTDLDDVKQSINDTFAKQQKADFLKKEAEKSKKVDDPN